MSVTTIEGGSLAGAPIHHRAESAKNQTAAVAETTAAATPTCRMPKTVQL